MRKIVAIPVILLVLFSGIRVNIASHYCNGSYIDTIVSLSGRLASCGMEENSGNTDGINIPHSCTDNTASYTFSSNYVPSTPGIQDVLKQVIQPVHIFNLNEQGVIADDVESFSGNGPPRYYQDGKTDPEVICVFRI